MAQTRVNLVTAVGQQDKQRRSSTAPRQKMEEVQARLVTPMQVLHDQQHRLLGRLTQEKVSQGGEETTFFVLRSKWRAVSSAVRPMTMGQTIGRSIGTCMTFAFAQPFFAKRPSYPFSSFSLSFTCARLTCV